MGNRKTQRSALRSRQTSPDQEFECEKVASWPEMARALYLTMVVETVRSILESKDHTVRIARTVKTAVNRVKARNYDLILMDLNLPDARGEQVIGWFRLKMKIDTPIIVLSVEIKAETVRLLKTLGVSGFVTKSENVEMRLREELAKVLGDDPYTF